MPPKHDEDLFKDTTMTFGEHLEELRKCLFKSVLGLTVGFIAGLYFGGDVVQFIQAPAKQALERYLMKDKQGRARAGVPSTLYIDKRQLWDAMQQVFPEKFSAGDAPPETVVVEDAPPTLDGYIPLEVFTKAADDSRAELTTLGPYEAFAVYIKASLLLGLLLSSPWVFFQIWSFVAAGLYPHEKNYVYLYMPFSLGLFLLGAGLAFFFVFEPVMDFFFDFNRSIGLRPDIRLNEWLGFVLLMPVGFGVSFQLPLVMLFLERIGVFSVKTYLAKWRIAMLTICILSMVLTPSGDPYSMLLMCVPLCVLYYLGIGLCHWLPKHRNPFDESNEKRRETPASV